MFRDKLNDEGDALSERTHAFRNEIKKKFNDSKPRHPSKIKINFDISLIIGKNRGNITKDKGSEMHVAENKAAEKQSNANPNNHEILLNDFKESPVENSGHMTKEKSAENSGTMTNQTSGENDIHMANETSENSVQTNNENAENDDHMDNRKSSENIGHMANETSENNFRMGNQTSDTNDQIDNGNSMENNAQMGNETSAENNEQVSNEIFSGNDNPLDNDKSSEEDVNVNDELSTERYHFDNPAEKHIPINEMLVKNVNIRNREVLRKEKNKCQKEKLCDRKYVINDVKTGKHKYPKLQQNANDVGVDTFNASNIKYLSDPSKNSETDNSANNDKANKSSNPKAIFHKSSTPEAVLHKSSTPKAIFHKSSTPEAVLHKSSTPKAIFHKLSTPKAIFHKSSTLEVLHKSSTPNGVLHKSSTPEVLHKSSTPEVLHKSSTPNGVLHKLSTPEVLHKSSKAEATLHISETSDKKTKPSATSELDDMDIEVSSIDKMPKTPSFIQTNNTRSRDINKKHTEPIPQSIDDIDIEVETYKKPKAKRTHRRHHRHIFHPTYLNNKNDIIKPADDDIDMEVVMVPANS